MKIMRGGRPVQGFALGGSFFGTKIDDLDRLIKNKDVEMSAMGVEVAKSSDSSIQQDWTALNQAYQAARAVGLKMITDSRGSSVPEILQPVDPDVPLKAIVAVLQPSEHQVTRGSKQDIANRLMASGWKPSYQLDNRPKGSAAPLPPPPSTDPPTPAAASSSAPAAPPATPPNADSPWLVPAIVAGGVVLLGGVLVVVARQRAA